MRLCNGLSFFSKRICLFVCLYLLIMSKLKSEATNTTTRNKGSPQFKYDVFFNFLGADIRRGFLAHLIAAFSKEPILLFVDDDEFPRDELSQSLVAAIESSLISLVIFSKDYAFSRRCLDELVKIIQCKDKYEQIVIPVFYEVDPSDVRKQMATYGKAFAQHEKMYNLTRVLAWKYALKESADIAGYDSSKFWYDAVLVEKIVESVLTRLGHHGQQVKKKLIIRYAKQISHVESLLQVQSKDVRAIGLWGMSGIGKTIIANEVFERLCPEYDHCYFMANVREESERHGVIYLKEKLYSTLLKEDDLKTETLSYFDKRRLRSMKVLVVFDDVSDSQQLEILIGTLDLFGGGSRIIVTTRDKQLLAETVDDVYEVKALDLDASFQPFNLNTTEQNHLKIEYHEPSKRMISYAKGIPLILKVLGHLLRGKDKNIWESQLEWLKKVPVKKVQDANGLNYNNLDRNEENMFLDISCFFDDLIVDDVKLLLKCSGYSVEVELESLQNNSLLTISLDNIVSMHRIVQETAWEMALEEHFTDTGYQNLPPDPDDIYQVLQNF